MTRPRLLLVEDHALVAEGLKGMLGREFDIVGIVEDGARVMSAVGALRPAVVLLDLSLPGRAGMEVLGDLASAHPGVRVLVVTMYVNRTLAEMAFKQGAAGFIPKNATSDELKTAIHEVLAGRRYLSPKVPRRTQRGGVADPLGFGRLTPRQQEIMRLIAKGLSSEQIAQQLHVSLWTVHFHRKNIRRELGLKSDQEMYRYAMLVALSDEGMAPTQ